MPLIELAVRKSYGPTASTSDERGGRRASHRQLSWRPYWLITTHKISQLEVLTIGSEGDEALPVFSFKEEAEMYLCFWAGAASEDWNVRQTSIGELTSVLYGQCASVGQVALDPLPERHLADHEMLWSPMSRDGFIEFLISG